MMLVQVQVHGGGMLPSGFVNGAGEAIFMEGIDLHVDVEGFFKSGKLIIADTLEVVNPFFYTLTKKLLSWTF